MSKEVTCPKCGNIFKIPYPQGSVKSITCPECGRIQEVAVPERYKDVTDWVVHLAAGFNPSRGEVATRCRYCGVLLHIDFR